jgi:diguanylate cyclase (GGDEF)-like protein
MVNLKENSYRNYDILPCGAVIFSYNEKITVFYSNEIFKHAFGENIKLHQDDCKTVKNAIIVSDTPQRVSVRIKNTVDKYVYVCMSLVKICDDKILALLTDDSKNVITQQNFENLRKKALIDPLSKIYNRAAAVDKINERIKKLQVYEECALIVIDLDNFKKINDTFGHLYGDAVIAMAAGSMKSIVDKSDIIGRFGGDEFFIFTTKANRGELDKKLESIRLSIMKMRLDKNDQEDISCSIGITVNRGRTDYNELFAQADSALYKAKLKGKNRFEYFDGEYIDGHELNYAQSDDEIEITEPIINQDITAVGLEIASKSRNAENAVSNLMRHIGVALDMDCIQIMQFDTIEDKVSICYQWWKEHNGEYNLVLTDKKAGYYVHNDLMIFRDKFEKDKIFRYTPDFKTGFSKKFCDVFDASSFTNFVYSSNSQNEDIFYVVCYHCEDINRIWSDNELNDMFEIMKILSVFMKSANVKSEREKQLEDMLDHSKFGLYSLNKLYEEAGRIGRESRNNDEKLAVVDFDIKGLYEFNNVYGSAEGNKVISKFASYLRTADENKIISCFLPGTDRFVTIFRYDASENIKLIIEDSLNDFCKNMGDYKDYPLIIKAGLCFFEQGQKISRAIAEAQHAKRGINSDKCFCVTCNIKEENTPIQYK